MKAREIFASLGICALCLSGCSNIKSDAVATETAGQNQVNVSKSEAGETGLAAASANVQAVKATPQQFVTLTDPAENAFTLRMPAGWKNEAYLDRSTRFPKSVATSVSPDKSTVLFIGDPGIPYFSEPTEMTARFKQMGLEDPTMPAKPFVAAEAFFVDYVQQKFGHLPKFRLLGKGPSPEFSAIINRLVNKNGNAFAVTTSQVLFDYETDGKPTHALINGATCTNKTVWFAEVNGITTTGDPKAYQDLLLAVAASGKTNEKWQAQENRKHEQTMAQMRQNHQNDQNLYNTWNQQHQARMNGIREAGRAHNQNWQNKQNQIDQQNQNWRQNQATGDRTHDRFINVIRGENTVKDKSGNTYQVDNSYDSYYVNPNDNSYIGTNSPNGIDDLQQTDGFNPDNYEEAEIVE